MNNDIRIKVVGLGGFGLSTVEMMSLKVVGADFLGLSNKYALISDSSLSEKILLGGGVTTNHSPELGKRRVQETKDEIIKSLEGYDVIIIITALGFGTGTGGAPLIASIAKELGSFTIAICTTPFAFEGTNKDAVAKTGLFQLKAVCDSIMVISNQKLIKGQTKPQDGVEEKLTDVKNLIRYTVNSMINMLHFSNGYNISSFDAFKNLYRTSKETFFGCGAVIGLDQAVSALRHAAKTDLLTSSLSNANKVLLTIDYKEEIPREVINLLLDEIKNISGDDVEITYTTSINPDSMGILFISIFATGIDIKDNKGLSDFDKLKDAINPNNFL